MKTFKEELENLLNKHSKDSELDTPDFLLAQYIINCLSNFKTISKERDGWYGFVTISHKRDKLS